MNIGQHPSVFMGAMLVMYCLGIVLGDSISWYPPLTVEAGVILLVLIICVVFVRRQSKLTAMAVALLFLLTGHLQFLGAMSLPEKDISSYADNEITVKGTLCGDPRITEDADGVKHLRYILKTSQVKQGKEWNNTSGSIIVYCRTGKNQQEKGDGGSASYGRSGDSVQVSGTLRQLHGYQNPGRMNMIMSLRSQGIHGQLVASKYSLRLKAEDVDWLLHIAGDIREKYRSLMEAAMSPADAAAIFAMLFGGYEGIKPELLESFTTTGIVHILSVSGSHITLMAGTAALIGRLLHLPQKATTGLATIIIIMYGILAGAVPPVIRSAVMGILTLLALSLGRERDARHILCITAFVMLLINPLLIFDISFQLSFGATAGLLYISQPIRKLLLKSLPDFVATSLAITIGAQLSVLPLLAWYFNVISVSSLLANFIVVPIVEWIIVIGLFAGIVGAVIPFLGKVIFICASIMLGLVYEMTRLIAQLPGSKIYLPTMNMVASCVYYLLLLVALRQINGHSEKQMDYIERIVASCLIIMLVVWGGWKLSQHDELQVHFIDVGQGNSALVITPHGHAFMIDTGGVRDKGYDIGARVDVPYLLHYGVRRLDYIFLTHAHDDHAAGVRGISGSIPIGAIMIGHEGTGEYMKTFGTQNHAVREELMSTLHVGQVVEIDGVRVEILFSPEQDEAMSIGNATGNEYSNLIRVSYGDASFLFTGDLVKEQEKHLVEKGTNLKSTVLQVGHHGSHTSSCVEFLHAVNPSWAVISCGYGNSFGHPHQDIVDRYKSETNARVMRTDKQGAIVFCTDGKKMKVTAFNDCYER